ncbi:hypothetical protein C2857_006907 [Epichloe festucae Fl1]|uniref:Uncharacterized protein n=1 Tax=Epichloe festucae (strain Fl1) TaxID=877507 RepID=A0A7S9PUI6_EPIFF|nr:hypothetical protein C2857_006907 [Epichloe festucae Fl1]
MARFSFHIAGRKKQPVHPPTHLPPTSKAHRILGSTPLSIDAPAGWDNASISITTDDRSANAAARYSAPDLGTDDYTDDDQVVFANQDKVWGEASDLAHPLRLNAVNAQTPTKTAPTDTTGRLRMSRSFSTIRSWYEKSKSPPVLSQQTSSPSAANGLPPYTSDEGTARTKKKKKKPAMLDLSRTGIQDQDTVGSGPWTTSRMDRMLTSPSLLPPSSSMSIHSCDSRKPTRKFTNETLQIPAPETPRSNRSGSGRLGHGSPNDLPSLYDHYEQMSIRQVMSQISTPNLQVTGDGRSMLENVAEGEYEDEVNNFEIYPCRSTPDSSETPRTGAVLRSDWQSSPGGAARSVSSRQTKTSKNTERSLDGRDLLQTSVLMLSSDSEQDDDDDEDLEGPRLFAAGQSPASASSPRPFNAPGRFSSSTESRSRSARDTRPGADCGASCSSRQGKRTSFAENNTYIIVPSYGSRRDAPGGVASRSATDCGDQPLSLGSPTSSVMSDHSNSSAATWQDESGYGIQEARAITMLPARRPSDVAIETRHTASSVAGDGVLRSPGLHRASSGDQPTPPPPLSPTPVDFYIRSAHSSVDGSGRHSRLMAVTPQEEMLLSALRNKQQSSRQAPMSQVSEVNEQENDTIQETEAETKSTTQAGHAVAAPDSADSQTDESTHSQQKRTVDARKRLVPLILTSGFNPGAAVVPPSPSGPPPSMSLPELPKARKSIRRSASHETASTPIQQEVVPLFLDDVEPSPDPDDIRDWQSATSPVVEPPLSPSALGTMPRRDEDNQSESCCSPAESPRADSPALLHPHSFSRPNAGKQDLAGKQGKEGVPRPDSPVSADSFPPVPTKRTTRTSMARLSAFGPASLANVGELGWWGDDD